jgi:hypothetical protein
MENQLRTMQDEPTVEQEDHSEKSSGQFLGLIVMSH